MPQPPPVTQVLLDSRSGFSLDGIPLTNWTRNPELALAPEDFRAAPTRTVRKFVLHTTQGLWPQRLIEGAGADSERAENVSRYWRRNKASASTPVIVDTNGQLVQTHYLIPVIAWHAKGASMDSIGVEVVQVSDGNAVYSASCLTVARLIHGTIQAQHRQVSLLNPSDASHPLPWLEVRTSYPTDGTRPRAVAPETRGVFGHRDVRPLDRGRGDPGDFIMVRVAEVLEGLAAIGPVRYQVVRT